MEKIEKNNKNATIDHLNKVLCVKNIKLKEKSKQIAELQWEKKAMQSALQQKESDKSKEVTRCESRIWDLEDELHNLKTSNDQRLADRDARIEELEGIVRHNNRVITNLDKKVGPQETDRFKLRKKLNRKDWNLTKLESEFRNLEKEKGRLAKKLKKYKSKAKLNSKIENYFIQRGELVCNLLKDLEAKKQTITRLTKQLEVTLMAFAQLINSDNDLQCVNQLLHTDLTMDTRKGTKEAHDSCVDFVSAIPTEGASKIIEGSSCDNLEQQNVEGKDDSLDFVLVSKKYLDDSELLKVKNCTLQTDFDKERSEHQETIGELKTKLRLKDTEIVELGKMEEKQNSDNTELKIFCQKQEKELDELRLALENMKVKNKELVDEFSAKLNFKEEIIKKLEDDQKVGASLYENEIFDDSQEKEECAMPGQKRRLPAQSSKLNKKAKVDRSHSIIIRSEKEKESTAVTNDAPVDPDGMQVKDAATMNEPVESTSSTADFLAQSKKISGLTASEAQPAHEGKQRDQTSAKTSAGTPCNSAANTIGSVNDNGDTSSQKYYGLDENDVIVTTKVDKATVTDDLVYTEDKGINTECARSEQCDNTSLDFSNWSNKAERIVQEDRFIANVCAQLKKKLKEAKCKKDCTKRKCPKCRESERNYFEEFKRKILSSKLDSPEGALRALRTTALNQTGIYLD